MAVSWKTAPAATTAPVSRLFSSVAGTDTYQLSRWFLRFDLSSYAGGSATVYPDASSGAITRTETLPTGSPTPGVDP